MEHVWRKIEELRADFDLLQEDCTPIDVFTFLEVDLGLDPIPFDELAAKYRVEAAIKADFSGIYLDAQQYALMEKGPEWKLNRLRFTVATNWPTIIFTRISPQESNFASMTDFARWTENYGGRKHKAEQEANEFAGRLLVPEARLGGLFDEFAARPNGSFRTSWKVDRSATSSRKESHPGSA